MGWLIKSYKRAVQNTDDRYLVISLSTMRYIIEWLVTTYLSLLHNILLIIIIFFHLFYMETFRH